MNRVLQNSGNSNFNLLVFPSSGVIAQSTGSDPCTRRFGSIYFCTDIHHPAKCSQETLRIGGRL
jgi:hypothetical protein